MSMITTMMKEIWKKWRDGYTVITGRNTVRE